jgi:hypothetical protein
MCPGSVPTVMSFIAILVPVLGLLIVASMPTIIFFIVVLTLGLATITSILTTTPFIVTLSLGLLTIKDILTFIFTLALNLLLIVVFLLVEVKGFLDVFRFLL